MNTQSLNYDDIAGMIDHAVLNPGATNDNVIKGAEVAIQFGVASLCIRPSDVALAGPLLEGSPVKLSTVIGFPHGAELVGVKLEAARRALEAGVEELDVVMNVGQLLSGNDALVTEEISRMTELVHEHGQKVKIIFENCYLDADKIAEACDICNDANVDWVKTSTGFGTYGARAEDVKIMREKALDHIGVKASGGIRTLDDVLLFRELGCSRIGASATAAILEDLKSRIGG